ncbi:hypothetical protein G647_01032 [Cladophialophora carrionii CBS 160.54]|uniref:Transcription factor domain-containing protein n=1 Tax=Cladophialophora carrionii CBS 160.54 TaxID=1279043 RepID=V9DRK6_9EURO|nr:uncharacterized protein G647_01032 [Cladophialophora carrionii CBS 160.54]ETI28582.1 hypothetical protein G647_01032 [Cladophialophora carrionii CBS 160.54]
MALVPLGQGKVKPTTPLIIENEALASLPSKSNNSPPLITDFHVQRDSSCATECVDFHDVRYGQVPETMGRDSLRPLDAVQWEGSVTLRRRADVLPRESESLTHDIDEGATYSSEDRGHARKETIPSKPTARQHAARKPHLKRAVKGRKHVHGFYPKKAVSKKEKPDESLPVLRYNEGPSWLLELDGEEINPLLPSPFPNDLVRRHMHSLPEVLAKLVSKAALSAPYGRAFSSDLMASLSMHPAQLHAMMFAVMVHDRIQQGISNPTATELMVGMEAIRHLNKEISSPDPERALSDSNIWAVLVLAYSGREDKLRPAQSYPRQSFLRELQSIHIYLKMDIVIEHVLGLVKMMELLGDLRKIKTPGIAQTVSWAGVMGAVRNLTRPIFPFVSHTATFVHEDGRLAVSQHEREAVAKDLGLLGAGFWQVWSLNAASTAAYLDRLFEVIQDMADFTIVVENHASGRWIPRTSPEIIDQRNFVQHKLMSLHSEEELVVSGGLVAEDIDVQYETCRLACIVYSFLVVFPVPPVVGPFETLVGRLKRTLKATDWTVFDRPRLRLHLWILIMGSIASIGLPDRPWFLLRVMEVLEDVGMTNWKGLKALLKTFLWHPRTSDLDGLDIWKATQHADTPDLAQ